MLIELQGQIERITYTSEESGFTVARVKVPGRRDLVCVVRTGAFFPLITVSKFRILTWIAFC